MTTMWSLSVIEVGVVRIYQYEQNLPIELGKFCHFLTLFTGKPTQEIEN